MKPNRISKTQRRLACLALLVSCLAALAPQARAAETLVAVAANFTGAAREVAAAFHDETGHSATLSLGSTGKLYAQIAHGAPYQLFLAADAQRPILAEREGLAVAGSRFTYAIGRLVLFSADPELVDGEAAVLHAPDAFQRLAIANPITAPYGAAAAEVLTRLGIQQAVRGRIVRGDNIAQTYQFVATGNAQLGFVALSQAVNDPGGSRWMVPQEWHDPIRQDAVLLNPGRGNPAAAAFLDFLKGARARAIIEAFGYDIP